MTDSPSAGPMIVGAVEVGYEKRARAAQEQATRMRIIEAAIDLHGSVGPARTTVSAIAERADVRRATVYRHFPDERALLLGCSGTWAERNRPPDPGAWAAETDPEVRLRTALDAIYGWYEQVEPMLTSVLRDAETMPIIDEIQRKGRLAYLGAVEDMLAAGWGVRGKAARRLRATIGLALDFFAWRGLHERGLERADAVAVMATAVRASAA
ncbi:MAG TPA: helix-turn-helix domain-containing protein [Solirubrobacteraceae bacterium]|nr:helix-turn-helix domain-containing protein [Solirubrobacteraceae bacterium]